MLSEISELHVCIVLFVGVVAWKMLPLLCSIIFNSIFSNFRSSFGPETLPSGLCMREFYSWHQCFHNMVNFYSGKQLKIVCGSLGIGIHAPFFEYGGPNYSTLSDFKNSYGSWDVHCWLEDKDGNVFDIFTPHMVRVERMRGKRTAYRARDVVSGSKAHLQRMGLVYIPAPKTIQREICKSMQHWH